MTIHEMTTYELWNLCITSLAAVAVVATFVIYYFLLKETRRASKAQNLLALINFLQTQDVREARRVVRKDLGSRTSSSWKPEEEQAAALTCSTYDVAAILIRQKLVPAAPIIENWGPSVQHCHEVLKEYVAELRRPENSGAAYWNNFDWLYREVVKSRGENGT